jgi:hypothetical protein
MNRQAARVDPLQGNVRQATAPKARSDSEAPKPLGSSRLAKAACSIFDSCPSVSICCGSLFSESASHALENGISLSPDVTSVLQEAANISRVYLIFHDDSPDGLLSAILGSALEAAGVLGTGPGQIPKHRYLCCSTETGKIATIRQLEAALHVESQARVHAELSRFKIRQWLVGSPSETTSIVAKILQD